MTNDVLYKDMFYFLKRALLLLVLLLLPLGAQAGLIRDAEVESDLRTIATPIFENAGLNPSQVQIIVINDDSVNAFVAEGQNLFLYTGLLLEAKTVAQLGGVIAHESGHMAGGHLIRMKNISERASLENMAATLAGIAIGVGAGSGDAGMATAMGGSQYALRNMLRNSRVFESSADQAGMATLDRAGLSTQGMADFLEDLSSQESLPEMQRSPYLLTHPMTRERLEAVEAFTAKSKNKDKKWPADWDDKFQRIRAKILAFTQPGRAETEYANDQSFVGRYAVAIAAYRQGRVAESLIQLDALQKLEQQNPWLYDLRGQIQFEQGHIPEAIAAYRRALALSPETGLLHFYLAQSLLQQNDTASNSEAIQHLESARTRGERDNPSVYHWLAVAYGRRGDEGHAKLSLSEEALLKGDANFALSQAHAAEKLLSHDANGQLRARDLIAAAERLREQKRKKEDS